MGDSIKRIDIKEFREIGFLQEVNRQFFHPLGLALEVKVEDDGTETLGGVWDYRDDPEGMCFAGHTVDQIDDGIQKKLRVEEEWGRHKEARIKMFRSEIQPVTNFGRDVG